MSPDEAVIQGMDLLLGIEAADTIVYERIGQGVVHTAGAGAEVLQRMLEQDGVRAFADQDRSRSLCVVASGTGQRRRRKPPASRSGALPARGG